MSVNNEFKSLVKIHHICTAALYVIFLLCVFMNLYVLLSREETIFYLRVYHSIVAVLMICCILVQFEFLIRTRNLPKLDEPHEIPDPALIGAVALTIGIVLGYLYFIIFNYAFQSCDKLVDAIYSSELWLESVYDVVMATFSALSLVYILQRRYYGAINSNLDKVGRLFINMTFCIVWMKVVVYKAYLSHQELCQRKELEGYWCPVMKRYYDCSPSDDLHGMQKVWYYINKGVLSSAIIACASEFFPVLIVAHWLSNGGAEEKAESIHRRATRKHRGIRALLNEFMKDISRVRVEEYDENVLPLQIYRPMVYLFWIWAITTCLASTVKWLVYFYYTIDFDELVAHNWLVNDYIGIAANTMQIFLFAPMYIWCRTISDSRLDAHHKAHARGDISLLFGCNFILLIKLVLQSTETIYQQKDGFIKMSDAIINVYNIAAMQLNQWIQYFIIRRILALSDRDCRATKSFLPLFGLTGFLISWVHFGVTFFETSLIKYQLTDETFRFSQTTLICMIFTQTLFPADYLFAFTASGCYLELLQRYLNMGFFQLGDPCLPASHSHIVHHTQHGAHSHNTAHEHEQQSTSAFGGLTKFMRAAEIMYRKRNESLGRTDAITPMANGISPNSKPKNL